MAASMLKMPSEMCLANLAGFFGTAQPFGRLAACARDLASDLQDSSGHLRVGSIVSTNLSSALEGLNHVGLRGLRVFSLDLSGTTQLSKQEIEQGIRQLAASLSKASSLQVFMLRLSCFDASMDRLRVGLSSWEALIRCLGELAKYDQLRSLHLSSINIKNSRAVQNVSMVGCSTAAQVCCKDSQQTAKLPAVFDSPRKLRRSATELTPGAGAASAAAPPQISFLDALAGLSSLEELVLTHDEIFGNTAEMLLPVLHKMKYLKRVDLTRNHIPKQVIQTLRMAVPQNVELCGDDLQTLFC